MFAATRIGVMASKNVGISFVGSASAAWTTANTTIPLPAGAQVGDTVVVCVLVYADQGSSYTTAIAPVFVTSGYTQRASASFGSIVSGYTKRMTGTADTSLVIQGSPYYAYVAVLQVFRGVDSTNPLDVSAVSQSTYGAIDPPAITPVTPGTVVVGMGAGAHSSSALPADMSGYNTISRGAPVFGAYYPRAVIASKLWLGSGAENPPYWGAADANQSGSLTLALRPGT